MAIRYPIIPSAQTIISLCDQKAIHHIVLSPGSRNAPLLIGFSHHPNMHCYSIVDERCAGFFALGMAQQLGTAVVLVCTSGSALLNYYPAVSEAFYSNIPLVVISADRPITRVGIGDGQTIRQENVFQNHIEYSANLIDTSSDTDISATQYPEKHAYNQIEINTALNTAQIKQGPVHINVPFSEPLYETTSQQIIDAKSTDILEPIPYFRPQLLEDCKEVWKQSTKKMILIGCLSPGLIDPKWIDHLAADPSVLLLTESTSNVHHTACIHAIDQLITSFSELEKADFSPQLLITLGGMVISKRLKSLLRKYPPNSHWHIDNKCKMDTFFALTKHIKCKVDSFFNAFLPACQYVDSTYQKDWLQLRKERRRQHHVYLDSVPFSDLSVYHYIFRNLPKKQLLHLSNSSTIRYMQLFELSSGWEVFCNRGTSGIEGSSATAIGSAVVSKLPTTLITGDLSFFYDSNALWNVYIPKNFKIILINNQGGGIFRILPGKEETETYSKYFETSHNLTAKQLCEMYGLTYYQVDSMESLAENFGMLFQKNNPDQAQLLEVITPRLRNDSVLLDYFKFLDLREEFSKSLFKKNAT